jgi:hypothetical protein
MLSCPYKHYLGYVKRLRLKKPVRPLYFGSDFHKLLEFRNDKKGLKVALSEIKEKFYEMPASWQSDLGEDYVQDIREIFTDYRRVYKDTPQPHETERPFEILIGYYKGEPVYFIGIIDELYKYKRHGEKFIKVGEHKTFNRAPDLNTLVMNTQSSLYAKATLLETGILPSSVIWDYIKSTPAKRPIWLEKTQRFSNAKSADITHYSWNRACKEREIDDEKILNQGLIYQSNITNYYKRIELDLHPGMVDSVWDGFVYTAKQIVAHGEKNKTKNITMNCKWCNYRDICYAEFTGGDVDYLIKKNYEVKEDKVESIEPIEEET